MELSFGSFGILWFFISLLLKTSRTYGNPPVSNNMQLLQEELKKIVEETETLKKGNNELIKEINMTEISCNEKLSKLKNARYSLITTLIKQNETLGVLMQRLVEEDVVNDNLESKLKELYSDLDVLGVIYETKYQELIFLENRRLNGTDLHCETIIKKFENPKINRIKSAIQIRSRSSYLSKFKPNNYTEMALENKIGVAEVLKSQLKSEYEVLTLKTKNNKELCLLKESNLKKNIAFIEEVLKSVEESVEVLNSNINTSIFLTESLKVEIKFGEKLLSTMKENMLKFNQVKELFQRDEQCYATIKEIA